MMRVKKINIVLKLVIHVTNKLKICADTIQIIYPNCFSPEKWCLRGVQIYNPKKSEEHTLFFEIFIL